LNEWQNLNRIRGVGELPTPSGAVQDKISLGSAEKSAISGRAKRVRDAEGKNRNTINTLRLICVMF
jgi:hypothetical protein